KEVSDLIDSMGKHSIICQANVNDFPQVNRMRDEVVKQFGRIDILVNNAGIVRDKSFVKMTPQMWTEVRQDREYILGYRENGQPRTGELCSFEGRIDSSIANAGKRINLHESS
ncbi:MAG: SDR family oxidoreductase, partial [Candidatus Methanoperedens sp.]|nr:SDR family oxidoreductase [Candidatus Methanoperedens sp.]